MSRIRNIVMAGALAFATAVPAVEAAPIMNAPLTVEKASDVSKVGCWRCRGWRGRYWGHRGWRGRYWGPRVWVAPVIVVGPRRHWAWCGPRWNRYRCRVRY